MTEMPLQISGLDYRSGKPMTLTIGGGQITAQHAAIAMDSGERWLAPGLIDLQLNGYAGIDLNQPPLTAKDVRSLTGRLWQHGVTCYLPTLITAPPEAIAQAIRAIVEACDQDALVARTIAGIHLEGPFISPEDGPRGAHPPAYVCPPSWELLQQWQALAGGRIRLITLSPEWPGTTEFIKRCRATGIQVAIGHTAASPEQIRAAAQAGARLSTHFGNGAHLMLPRHPNYLWEQLADDRLWVSLIGDGFHLPEAVLKVALRVKGGRALLISDAVALGGLPPGSYRTPIGGRVVLSDAGRLSLEEQPELLAGSVQLLAEAIANLERRKLASFAEAWELGSLRPAAFLGLAQSRGLRTGAPADLVVLTRERGRLRVRRCYKAGVPVAGDEPSEEWPHAE